MKAITRYTTPFVAAAVLFGVLAQQAFGTYGANNKCDTVHSVTCPDPGICQPTGHCTNPSFSKCVEAAEYGVCVAFPANNCTKAAVGCKFEDWTVNCGAALAVYTTPYCYRECGSKLN